MTEQPQPPLVEPTQPQPPTGQPAAPVLEPAKNYTDGWGIASIILAVMSLSLPGFIVGLIGAGKAKRLGVSPVLSRIGWIVNLVMMIFMIIVAAIFFAYLVTHPEAYNQHAQSSTNQSTTKDVKTVAGKMYTIEVPNSFTDMKADYSGTDVAQGDDMANLYIISYADKAEDIATGTSVTDYANKAFESFQADTNFTGQTRSQLPVGTIPNPSSLDVADYRMEANNGIKKYVYYDRYIKTAKGYYMLTTWTTPGELATNTETIKQILASFHETKQ